jgi:transposase
MKGSITGIAPPSRFPRAKPLAAWAGLCPGNPGSAGQRQSGHVRQGSRGLRRVRGEMAPGAARSQQPSLAARYRCLATGAGRKKPWARSGTPFSGSPPTC